MIALYLNNSRVYPEVGENIKLTQQNPYFSLAGTYTLDVTLPMDIWENRQFFGSISRMDTAKHARSMECRLTSDGATIMVGLAHITEVTEKTVKVQLEGGNSEINFLSEEGGAYIDEMDISPFGTPIAVWFETVNATFDGWKAINLVSLIEFVIYACGFHITENLLNRTPWNRIYCVPKDASDIVSNQLPHWKASEFLQQVSRLFNVTFAADSLTHTVRIVSNREYVSSAAVTTLEPVDEYKAEISQEGDTPEVMALSNANLRYSLSDSEFHDIDCIPDDARKALQKREYDSYAQLLAAWQAMDVTERKRYIFVCPQGCYASWVREPMWHDEQQQERLTYIDCFRPLVRDGSSEEYTELKIVPVAIRQAYKEYHTGPNEYLWRYQLCPSTSGSDNGLRYNELGEDPTPQTVQEAVTEGVETEENESKDDCIEIVFRDWNMEHVWRQDEKVSWGNHTTEQLKWAAFFTDWKLKRGIFSDTPSNRDSLSLNPTDADHYIGELHQNPYSLNMDARHVFQFLSDTMPDPTNIFHIRGKRYFCEKIETNIRDGQIDRLMTGYFYELLES